MPKFYFNINDGRVRDLEGSELADLTAAKCEGVKLAGALICEAAGSFWDRGEWTMTVTDESRLTMFTLHLLGVESPAGGLTPRMHRHSA